MPTVVTVCAAGKVYELSVKGRKDRLRLLDCCCRI
jgi:hypothetical protein